MASFTRQGRSMNSINIDTLRVIAMKTDHEDIVLSRKEYLELLDAVEHQRKFIEYLETLLDATDKESQIRDLYIPELRSQLGEKTEYIVKLKAVVDAVKAMKSEMMKEQIWYCGIGCEFAEGVDEALADLERDD